VKFDSLVAVRLVDEFWSTPTQYPYLIHQIWSFKDINLFSACAAIFRGEKNTLVDSFAKFGLSASTGCKFFNFIPAFAVTFPIR